MRIWHLILSAMLASIIGCDGVTRVAGLVVGEDEVPLDNVTVTLETTNSGSKDGSQLTDVSTTGKDGEYGVMITHAPTRSLKFVLHAQKEGYVTHKENVAAGHYDMDRTLVLKRE
jgi:hypothetical protein